MDQPAGFSIVSVSLAASLIASFVSGFIADCLGRKWFLMVAAVIHTLGCIIEIAGQSQPAFFVGRIITGFSIGMLIPLYQSELAEPHNRGKLIAIYQLFITLGFCVAFWIGYGTFSIASDVSWRIPLGIQLIPGILLLLGIYFIPESPRWLIYRDQASDGLRILADLRSQGDTHQVQVRMEFSSILQEVQFDRMAYRHRFVSLFKKGTDNFRKRTLLGLGIHTFTQLSGINAILFYFPHILESAGVSGVYSALLGNGIGGLVNFIATCAVVFYIDRWGRRKILVMGALGMGLCMLTITIVSALFDQDLITTRTEIQLETSVMNPKASYSITVLLCIFIALFALSWGPIGWIYPAEIYPQMVRAYAMGITTSCSYLFSLIISLLSPFMFEKIGWKTYIFFTCMCLAMMSVVYLFYPETRANSLEEIQLIFSGALVDKRLDVHHPATAAEALIQLEQIKHQQQRERLAQQQIPLDF